MRTLVFFFFLITFSLGAFSQKSGFQLADEYYRAGEFEKAKVYYEPFIKNPGENLKVYEKYLHCLLETKQNEQAEKYLKKCVKEDPSYPRYKIDLAILYKQMGKDKESARILQKLVNETGKNTVLVQPATEYLLKKNLGETARDIYLLQRKQQQNNLIYSFELAEIYKSEHNMDAMIDELITLLTANAGDREYLKNKFQEFLTTQPEFDRFEEMLVARSQAEPGQTVYVELLVWLYLQKHDFYRAFIQAKSYDKRLHTQGDMLMEVGRIAMENKDYENASEVFDYLCKEYRPSPNYPVARRLRIETKENLVKNIYPVDPEKIRELIGDYKNLIKELGKNQQTFEAMRNLAHLYAFYADQKDSALLVLGELTHIPRADPQTLARCKLEMGDIYLLKGEPWESTLLYAQVEKSQKDQPLGHEAKLRNARLSYYKGEFDWAQEQLDILKMATSREIANDALDLSLLIQNNLALDTTEEAMREFAAIDLLLFQHKEDEALARLDGMLKRFPDHSLTDEVYFLQAKLYRRLGRFQEAIGRLELIENRYKTDIYGDNAAFLLANIYEENLHDKPKAMELYNKFLVDFPASIYTAEARKRFRQLRGDGLN